MSSYSTINTFHRSPSIAQIASYITISLQSCLFYIVIIQRIQPPALSVTLNVLFSFFLFVLFVSTFMCSYVDPSDHIMIEYKQGKKDKIKQNLASLLFCDFCHSYVTENARHCRNCDRCVQNFDHHCMWINNCVGSKNYKIFMVMIISTCCNLAVYIASVIILSVQKQWYNYFAQMIVSWVVLLVVFVFLVLLLNLNILHFYLIYKGYTTYQFIMVRREEERKAQILKMQKQNLKREERLKEAVQLAKQKVIELPKIQGSSSMNLANGQERIQQKRRNSQGSYTSNILNQNPNKQKFNQLNAHSSSGSESESISKSHKLFGEEEENEKTESHKSKHEELAGDNDETQSVRISQFFTMNKSFNILIDKQVPEKPNRTIQYYESLKGNKSMPVVLPAEMLNPQQNKDKKSKKILPQDSKLKSQKKLTKAHGEQPKKSYYF